MKTRWKILIGLGVFLLLAAASAWFTAHHRPQTAVEDYKQFLRDHGEKVSLDELIPPPVPAASNSLAAVQAAFGLFGSGDADIPEAMKMIAPGQALIGHRQPLALGFNFTNAWDDFDAAIKSRLPPIELLHQVLEKPVLDFQLDYKKSFDLLLPHLAQMKKSAQWLDAAIICQLHFGETDAAATNLMTMLALADRNAAEGIMISELVRIAIAAIAVAPTWEWLQSTNGSDAQLAALQQSWRQLDFIGQATNAFAMERVWGNQTIERARASHEEFQKIFETSGIFGGSGGSSSSPVSIWNWPPDWEAMTEKPRYATAESLWRSSWSYADELNGMKSDQIILETLRGMQARPGGCLKADYDAMMKRLAPLSPVRPSEKILRLLKIPDHAGLFGSGWFGNIVSKVLKMETAQRIVVTAIALKRFQLKHGHLPDKLSALAPDFLASVPMDPYSGKPLSYRLNADGSFLLYSVAENGVDDGGDPALPSTVTGSSFQWQNAKARDWVWPQPATAAEIKIYQDELAAKAALEALTDPATGLPAIEPPTPPPGTN